MRIKLQANIKHGITWAILCLVLAVVGAADDESSVTRIASLPVFTGALDAVTFSPDGTLIASGGRDNSVRIWSAETGANLRTIQGHTDWVMSVAFSPDGRLLVTGSRDNSVRLFDVDTGQLLRVITHHADEVRAVRFTPDGRVIASGGRDGMIYLYTVAGERVSELDQFGQAVWDLAFDPSGRTLASASESGTIWLWGLWHDKGAWLKQLNGHESPVTSLSYSDDGETLVSGGLDSTVRLWDMRPLSVRDSITPTSTMRGHLAPIMGVGFSSDDSIAVSVSLDGTVRLWDTGGEISIGTELSTITGNGAPLTHLALNPDGTAAISTGTDGVLNVWDMSDETLTMVVDSARPVTIAQNDLPQTQDSRAIPGVAATNGDTSTNTPAVRPPQAAVSVPPPAGRSLQIPSAGISVGVGTFYLDGVSWAIDPWEANAGHFQGTAWIDTGGNVVIGAHSEYPNGSAGAFKALYNVGLGDEIIVRDGDSARRYLVVNIRSVDYRDVSVVYPTTHSQLTLITCDIPSYVAEQNIYYERLVVEAREVQ